MADRSIQTRQSRIFHLPGIRVIGTGSYVPENVVANEDLASLGCDADWILQKFREDGYLGLLLRLENLDFLGPCP